MRKKVGSFFLALGCFVGYVCICLAWSFCLPDATVLAGYAGDLTFLLFGGILYFFVYQRKQEPSVFPGFSGAGWACLIGLFCLLYVFSQACGSALESVFPSSYMTVYTSLSGTELSLYLLLSVTVAPVCEELLFRGFLYRYLRQQFSLPVCLCLSAGLFALAHGTLGHVPVTVGLTLFVCLMIEWTGRLRYAIGFHMLYNLIGICYIFSMPLTFFWSVFSFCLVAAVLLFALAFRRFLLPRLQKGTGPKAVDVLQQRQDAWLEQKMREEACSDETKSSSDTP